MSEDVIKFIKCNLSDGSVYWSHAQKGENPLYSDSFEGDSGMNSHPNCSGIESAMVALATVRPPFKSCEIFKFIMPVIIIGITCVLGFVGNILSMVVLRKEPCHPVTAFLLTALALADLLFLIPIFLLMVPKGICESSEVQCPDEVNNLIPYIEKYGWALASMMHMGTVYITLLVTIHRYIFVCRPHEANSCSTVKKAKAQVCMVAVFAVLYNIPRFFEFDVLACGSKNCSDIATTPHQRVLTDVGNNLYYQIIYKNICFYLLMYLIPLTIISILSLKLIQALRNRRRKKHNKSPKTKYRDDNITFVLVIIIIIFILCQTPTPIQRLLYWIFGDAGAQCGHFFFYFEPIADYLAVINSCINFIIYVMFARRFRKTLGKMVTHCQETTIGGTQNNNFNHQMAFSADVQEMLDIDENGTMDTSRRPSETSVNFSRDRVIM